MSEEFKNAADFVVRAVAAATGPLPPEEMLEKAKAKKHSPTIVRRALWHLVSTGEIRLTSDMRIERGGEQRA